MYMGSIFLADQFIKNENKTLAAVAEDAKKYDDLINLSLGEPDTTTHKSIIQAAFEDAKQGHTHYTDSLGYKELRQAVCEYYKEEYDYQLNISEVMIVVGACHGMLLSLYATINQGDEVIIHEPYFTSYKTQIELVGGKPLILPTYETDQFEINIENLKQSITNKTKAMIINTPCNPTGANFSKTTMLAIAKIAKNYNLLLFTDDVYASFCYKERFIPMTTLPDMKERTITVNSFSKNFAMTGWRIGYVLAPPYVIDCMKTINENVCYTAPSISQRAALYALKMKKHIEPPYIKEYQDRIEYVYEKINAIPKISAIKPKGAIYLFVNIKETRFSSEEFCKKLLKEAHVLVIPGTLFGQSGEGYIRIACTVNQETLQMAFERIKKFIEKL